MTATTPGPLDVVEPETRPDTESATTRHAPGRGRGAVAVAVVAAAGAAILSFDVSAWQSIARAATYGATASTVGAALFTAFVGRDLVTDDLRALHRLVMASAALGIVAGIAVLGLQAINLAGSIGAVNGSVLDATLTGNVNISVTVRACGLVQIVMAVVLLRRDESDRPMASVMLVAGTLFSVASFTVTGHGATRDPIWLSTIAGAAHALTASLWFGGLVALLVVFRARRLADDLPGAGRSLARFALTMNHVLVWLIVSGMVLGLLELDSPGDVFDSSWGAVLLAKVGLVVAVLGLGAVNHERIQAASTPAVWRAGVAHLGVGDTGIALADAQPASTDWRAMDVAVRIEVALLVGVVVATGFLTGLSP